MAARKHSNSGAGNAITERERLSLVQTASIEQWFLLEQARAILKDHGRDVPPEVAFPLAVLLDRASIVADAINHFASEMTDLPAIDKLAMKGAMNLPSRRPDSVEA